MTCHDTKDSAGLYRFTYLFLKQSLFFFYIHRIYWNKNLKLCFSLGGTEVKVFNYHKTGATPVYIQRLFKIQNFCFASPTVPYACQSRKNNSF